MPGITITGLTKRFGDVAAVAGLDLAVRPGELVALLGPSGCGKTTTLRLVAGFMAPDAGEIRVGERVLSSPGTVIPPERRRMAMIFQSYALWPHMTVAQNVAYGLRFAKTPRAQRNDRVDEMLRAVQLAGYGARYPGELSGGQQQRVAVARALVVEPEILLLDEPLSNLDASLREEMRFEIRRLHERFGITTLYVTHDQAEAMVISDRAAVIRNGRVVQIGAPQELFERPRTRFVAEFIGKTNLIDAVADGAGSVARGRLRLRVAADGLTPGTPAVVSIRPHLIALGPTGRRADGAARREHARGHRGAGELPRRHGGLPGRPGGERRRPASRRPHPGARPRGRPGHGGGAGRGLRPAPRGRLTRRRLHPALSPSPRAQQAMR